MPASRANRSSTPSPLKADTSTATGIEAVLAQVEACAEGSARPSGARVRVWRAPMPVRSEGGDLRRPFGVAVAVEEFVFVVVVVVAVSDEAYEEGKSPGTPASLAALSPRPRPRPLPLYISSASSSPSCASRTLDSSATSTLFPARMTVKFGLARARASCKNVGSASNEARLLMS